MIRILQNWEEVGSAVCALQAAALPLHESPQKNWDHWLLRDTVKDLAPDAPILDLGCGDGFTLSFLSALGFRCLLGLDVAISWRARCRRLAWRFRGRSWRPLPYRLRRATMLSTGIPSASQGLVTCVSAIEHGVPAVPFISECARVLEPRGLLFLTTDYWDLVVEIPAETRHYGQPWMIYDQAGIEALIAAGGNAGLLPVQPVSQFPSCAERTAAWSGQRYTFACVVLRRER